MNGVRILGRSLRALAPRTSRTITTTAPKLGGGAWYYRTVNENVSKGTMLKANLLGAAMWYWVLYHLWYHYDDITGHHPYPDPSKWSDSELGIPPDSED